MDHLDTAPPVFSSSRIPRKISLLVNFCSFCITCGRDMGPRVIQCKDRKMEMKKIFSSTPCCCFPAESPWRLRSPTERFKQDYYPAREAQRAVSLNTRGKRIHSRGSMETPCLPENVPFQK
ncbi:hypothetical protein CIRG_08575 [Coccidioides immitis RMSCC 2394]|uniref:Uncharacterized protein n=1 Tax=Coccidioides immitis RMSCC 2394 TaxID=404692 RepID=A0A0J6YNZ3_COCIT|nr:hypothetical protein CIRG_08575 [Coccidioides immitis RMSCC 2394]